MDRADYIMRIGITNTRTQQFITPPMTNTISSSIIIITLPVFIILSNVRIILNPWFPTYEYHRPGFPSDSQGMDADTRNRLAINAIKFLVGDLDVSYLNNDIDVYGDPTYSNRELSHMQDVKSVISRVLGLWKISGAMLIAALLWLCIRPNTSAIIRQAVTNGSGVVIVMLIGLLAYIIINFDGFFTTFHQMVFESGTWMFSYTDMLIRLFPPRFWSDVAIYIAATSLFEGLLLWWGAKYI